MTVTVSFISPGSGGAGSNGVFKVRAQERLTIPGTTVNTTMVGELVLIGNGEAGMVAVAFGTTPDAAAVSDNSPVTSAGYPVGPGQVGAPLCPGVGGANINVKAIP
jgi:hypothetical protein